jgi:NADH dehydrogenase
MDDVSVVTGAFGFSGKYIARRLVAMGKKVRTLTAHPKPASFADQVTVSPLDFNDPSGLASGMRGATVLYNTYWIRFPHGSQTYEKAVQNTKVLLRAAEDAGIRRIVHVSITNPREHSPLGYFRGKAQIEKAISESKLTHAILRPAVILGVEDILVNNIAWLLRRFPVFAIAGSGDYHVRPIFVEDLAELAVRQGSENADNVTLDAVGRENYTFNELVFFLKGAVASNAKVIHVPPRMVVLLARMLGHAVKDVLLTEDEVRGLTANMLDSPASPAGATRFSAWVRENAAGLGTSYASELARHYR